MNKLDTILRRNAFVLTVCNYAQVRSQCMADTLRKNGFGNVHAWGALAYPARNTEQVFKAAALIILCNWKNAEDGFKKDSFPDREELLRIYSDYEHKIIRADEIEYDRWGDKTHPELVDICERFVQGLV